MVLHTNEYLNRYAANLHGSGYSNKIVLSRHQNRTVAFIKNLVDGILCLIASSQSAKHQLCSLLHIITLR